MCLVQELTLCFEHKDPRGCLVQLIRGGYSQVNFIESFQNAVRGFHYHKFNKEVFYVISGKIEIDVWKIDESEKADFSSYEEHIFQKGDFFGINSYTAHVFIYLTDSAIISMYDKGVEIDEYRRDIYKVSEENFLQIKRRF